MLNPAAVGLGNPSFAHRSFPLICSLLISAFFKRAIEQSLADSLFSALFAKEQMSDRSFFALFKRVTKRAIALSKRAKMSKK